MWFRFHVKLCVPYFQGKRDINKYHFLTEANQDDVVQYIRELNNIIKKKNIIEKSFRIFWS